MQSVWRNGALISSENVVDASDRGLLLGDGVFDTSLVLGGTVFRRKQHVARLLAALDVLEIPVAAAAIESAMDMAANGQIDGSIRLTVTRGPGPRGLRLPPAPRPTLIAASAPLAPAAMFLPVRVTITDIRRNETSPAASLKTTSYLDAIIANRRAERDGASEALFLNARANLACSSLANVFALAGDELVTPPISDGAMPGIIRGWLLEQASGFGLRAVERSIPAYRLPAMDALFLTNSLRLIAPLSIDAPPSVMPMPEAVRRLMEGLCNAIAAECGKDPRALGVMLPNE